MTASILTGIVILRYSKAKVSCGKRISRMHLTVDNPVYMFVLASCCADGAKKRGCADPRGDNLSHKTGVDINILLTIDEITFQEKNATRVIR